MAAFNLTAQINLRGPTNLKPIVSQIRRELGTVNTDISLKIDNKAIKSIDSATNRLNAMNKVLTQVRSNTASLNQSLRDLSGSLGTVQSASSGAATSVRKTSDSVEKVAKNVKVARTEMEEFGKQSALAIRRFAAFTVVTTGIFALTNAITSAFKAFISFDKELIRLQQVTGKGAIGVKILQDEITNLAVGLGVSSEALTQVSVTLAQAGFNIEQTKTALKALAKTELAPSFENLTKTTEGAIAAIRQFGLEAGELEAALGSINAVAAAFAVESGDIIAAIQRTGGVFASASKGVSEGTDALNEFISIFTSVRATTRESAETIATGLRTIFTRIQRGSTIKQLKEFGVELQDLEGKFVGPFEAVRRLSEALNQLDPRDIRFSTIVEELGGFRQIGKVIPLIQQFATAQQALGVAQRGQSSLTDAQIKAQQSLANQIAKVREQFLALIRDVGQSTVFQGFFKIITSLASGLISLASAFKPILPILAVFGAIKGVSSIGQFATGFFGGLKKGGGAGGTGQNIGESLSGAKEKARAEATTKAADAIRLNTDALKSLTSAVQSLDSTIKSRGGATLNQGGKVLGFNKGGIVPGGGRGDRVPAMLEPGEVVMNRKAVNKYGAGNLVRMNRYADGGKIEVTAKELKNRFRGSVAVKELITDQADREFYNQGKAINTNDNISFTRRLYKLNSPDLVNDSSGFEKAVAEKVRGQLTSEGRSDPNYPIDITNSNFGPLEVRNRRSSTSNRTLLDKLIRYYIKNNQRAQRLSNSPEIDDIKLGQIGLVYNSAKYDPPNAKELKLGGMIQKFESGSTGGVRVSSGKGRGKTGARGARSKYDFFGIEEYQKWSKPIYDEYYADPSLTWSSFLGIPMPPEIALYHKMVEDEVFTKGGAGLAVGKKFVRTPSENITDELRPYLEVDPSDPSQLGFYKEVIAKFAKQKAASASQTAKLGKESALTARESQFAAYTNAENAISEFKKTGMLSLDPGIMSYIKQSISNPDSLPLDSDDIQGIKKKLTKPNLDAFFALTGPESLPVSVQGQRTKLAEVFNSILDTYGRDTSDLEIDNIIGGVGSKLMNKSLGGLISNFMAGSVGGVGSSVGKISEDILERIKALGGKGGLVNLAPEAVSNAVRATGVSANQLLKTPVLKAMPDGAKFAPELEKLLEIAEKVQSDKVKQAQKQLEDNMKAASGGAYQFGLVSLYGPNGELGYSDVSDARELIGGDGTTKYLSQIVRKSLPQRYAEALASIQKDIAGLPARGAEAFQYTDIFGTDGPLAFDFDDTLVKGADIFAPNGGIDIRAYNDLEKVKEALVDSKLTLLGKELAKRLIDYPEMMDSIRVLTARPQSNAPLLASKLASLGLPIPEDKITGVSGGLNKVANLSELETLIDDNLGNIQAVSAAGKRSYLYNEPKGIDPNNQSSRKAMASIEGYDLEEIVRNLGVGISPDDADPNRPIDYPKGLGAGANIWGIKPTLPTDTKRTNDSNALSRMWAEAQRYFTENFAFGGKIDGVGFEEGGVVDAFQKALSSYVMDSTEINTSLARGETPNVESSVKSLDQLFKYSPPPQLFSGFGKNRTAILTGGIDPSIPEFVDLIDGLRTFPGYLSASENKNVADRFRSRESGALVTVKPKAPVIDVRTAVKDLGLSLPKGRLEEEEFIFPRQSKFMIDDFEYSSRTSYAKLKQLNRGGLMQRFASGGLAEEKNFGKIALRTGNRIQATYIKEGEAAEARSGQVIADKINSSLYAVQSSAATKGYGPKLYDIVMEAATAEGAMLTSDRRTVSDAAKGVWAYYFKNRSDVNKTPLDPENWVSNSRLLDEKLYGPPETWPPPTDPAWILQTGYSKSASDINNPNLVQKLARGGSSGTVPAMVSNGEAYVPPNVAKKIGYAKLDRMNQADKNGMGRYASGGSISTFKGPGSGTSDSIGPIGLPTGSYVIREKATKALGLNKGGGVGVQKFAAGGLPFDRSALTGIEKALELEAKALGISVSDLAKELKKTADETRKAALAAGKTKAEANKAAREAAGQKLDLTTLYQSDFGFLEQQIQGRAEKTTRVKAVERDISEDERRTKKESFGAQTRGFTRQQAYDAGVIREDYQSSGPGRGGTSTDVKIDLATEALVAPIKKEIANRYNQVYADEKAAIKAFYQERVNKALAAGEEITPIVNEANAVIAQTKADLKAAAESEIATATTQARSTVQEQGARRLDPFYDAKKAAEASVAGVPGMPKVNEQIRQEQSDYLRFKAEKAGMSVGGYKYSMAQKVGQAQFDVERETTLARTETKSIAAGRRRELQGINIKQSLQADTQEGRRVQSIIDEFAGNLQKADPSLGAGAAREAAIALAEGLSEGTKSVAEIVAGNETLKNTLEGNIDSTKILDEAFRRTALEMGESVENLKANVSSKQVQQQAFIKSTEGQRFGQLAEFAPGLTERFSKTGLGKGLGAGADFISGKGGRLSKAFAGAGGFTGIGAGLSVGAEALKQALPKSVTSDPNTAGALGALGGAGTGAAAGAQIGSIAGPIGSLVGGIGGAIIGGIQGFFNAKNQAILTNAIENVAKTTGELDIAFKKLETNASAVNLDNAQKAFGQVLGAQQDIRQMAFTAPSLTGTDAATIGGTALAGAATGAAIGALVGSVVPVLGTAIGAAVGGAIGGIGTAAYSFFNRPSKAQRIEALGATIQQSGANQAAATRLAENQLKFTATEDIDKAFKDSNPIVEQYKKGLLESAKAQGITNQKQLENISAQAEEQAALDAFMKLRKEAGATDEQIGKELEKNRKEAIATGKQSLEANAELLRKQTLLARATKEVAVATESLLDVYRRIGAEADKYGNNLQRFSTELDAILADIGGKGTIRNVDRKNEEILANVSAFSIDEVKAAAATTAGFLGNTPEAQNLANQAVGQKLVQDQIPALLRAAKGGDTETKDSALKQVEALLASQGLEGAAINTILEDLKTKLAEGQGLTEGELANEIQKSFSTVGKGLEALQKVQKQYNDTLQQARNLQNQYNKTLSEAQAFFVKAAQVRLNAEIDLAKALGRSPTLQQLNEPFDLEISSLTSGLVQSGALAAGDAGDPMAILAAMQANQQRISSLEETGKELGAAGANIPAGAAGDPLRQKLNSEQLKNIESIASLTEASAQGRKALEKLANDGTKAANALSKIQEQQQAVEGFANFAQQVFTAEPQQLAQMEIQATALNAALESGPEFMQSRFNRQQAFAGLEQAKQFLTPQEFKDTQADLLRKSFESQGFAGGDVVKEIGGKQFTLDEFIERVRGGADETDPNVIAFRQATEIQAAANDALGLTLETEATKISEAMATLEDFLSNQFPDILAQAVTKSREDATVKPEVKAAEKPQERSFAETRVTEAKQMQQQGRDKLKQLKEEEEGLSWWQRDSETVGRINQERRKAQQQIAGGKELEERFQPQAERDKVFREAQTSFDRSKQALDEARVKGEEMQAKKAQTEQTIEKARESRGGDRPVMVGGAGRRVAPTVAAAGMTVQPAQIPAVDITAQALRQEEIKARTEKVSQLGGTKTAKQEEIAEKEKETAKRENKLKAARRAAMAAGTLKDESGEIVNPNVLAAQEAVDSSKKSVDSAKQDLSSINEQITAEKQRLAALAEQQKGKTGISAAPPSTDSASMTRGDNNIAGISEQSSDIAKTTDTEVKSATEGVQTSVAQLQSPLDLVAQMATAALQSGSIYTHDTNLSEMLGLLNETMANFAAIPTSDPGFIVSDLKVLEALNNLQEPFAALEQMAIASLSEGINTKDATLSAVASTFTPAISQVSAAVSTLLTPIQSITSILSPILDSIASPIKAIAGYFGVQMSTNQALGAARGLVTAGPVGALAGYAGGTAIDAITAKKTEVATSQSITPNRLELASANASNRIISGPVQSTTAQQPPATASQPTPQSAQDAKLISIDPDSIEKLNTFNTNFATYVDKLVTFEFPTIPDVIEMKGNHVVDVRISGAAAFEGLKKDFEKMMQTEIKKAMGKIWGQSGGQMGDRPDGNT
jgi:hypothetical protein